MLSQRWYRISNNVFSLRENNSTLKYFFKLKIHIHVNEREREKKHFFLYRSNFANERIRPIKKLFWQHVKIKDIGILDFKTVSIFSCFVNSRPKQQRVLPWQRCAGCGAPPLQNRWPGLEWARGGSCCRPGGGGGRAECRSPAIAASIAP